MTTIHQSVLLEESIRALNLLPNQLVIDATLGGGGHAERILTSIGAGGRLLAFDADPQAISRAKSRLSDFGTRVVYVNNNFENLNTEATRHGFSGVSGIIFDLGWSSDQLADVGRGFSFQADGPLDMRFNGSVGITAAQVLNEYTESSLIDIFKNLGDEEKSVLIAKAIIRERAHKKISLVSDLVDVITRVKPVVRGRIHPTTKVWQALRIYINRELEVLTTALPQAVDLLAVGGRLVVISFHSGEDRLVKNFFKRESKDCLCPPHLPVCVCHHQATLKLITKKPIKPSLKEININPRSRSAVLRVAEKI